MRTLATAILVFSSLGCASARVTPVALPEPKLDWNPADGLLVCGETRIRIPDFLRSSVKQTKPDEVELALMPELALGALVIKARPPSAPPGDPDRMRTRLEDLVAPGTSFKAVGRLHHEGHAPVELLVGEANRANGLGGDKRFRLVTGIGRNLSTSCQLSAIEQLLPDSDTGPGLLALVESVVEQSEQEARQRGLLSEKDKRGLREGYQAAETMLKIAEVFLVIFEGAIRGAAH